MTHTLDIISSGLKCFFLRTKKEIIKAETKYVLSCNMYIGMILMYNKEKRNIVRTYSISNRLLKRVSLKILTTMKLQAANVEKIRLVI